MDYQTFNKKRSGKKGIRVARRKPPVPGSGRGKKAFGYEDGRWLTKEERAALK